jgi:hypothetical protein
MGPCFSAPGAMPLAMLNEAVGHSRKKCRAAPLGSRWSLPNETPGDAWGYWAVDLMSHTALAAVSQTPTGANAHRLIVVTRYTTKSTGCYERVDPLGREAETNLIPQCLR